MDIKEKLEGYKDMLKFYELWRDRCSSITEPKIEEIKTRIKELQKELDSL